MTTSSTEQSTSGSRHARLIGGTSLIAISVLILLVGQAQAKKDEKLLQLIQCTNNCLTEEATCQSGCCGRIFCKKSCLGVCFDNERVCEGSCDISFQGDPDGEFADVATQGPKGRALRITGPLRCPANAVVDLSVTLSQSTGAIAKGQLKLTCPDGDTNFAARALVIGSTKFQPLSPATACAVARIHVGAQGVRALQWCRELTVLPEGTELEE